MQRYTPLRFPSDFIFPPRAPAEMKDEGSKGCTEGALILKAKHLLQLEYSVTKTFGAANLWLTQLWKVILELVQFAVATAPNNFVNPRLRPMLVPIPVRNIRARKDLLVPVKKGR